MRARGAIGAQVEAMESEDLLSIQQQLFERQWDHIWSRSPFYQRKLSAAGFRASLCPPLTALRELPFTEKSELRTSLDRSPPLGEHLAADPRSVRQVQMSSGTSGRPSMVALTTADAAGWSEVIRRGYVAVGYSADDTILHGFGMSRGWAGGLPMVEGVIALGATVLPIGAEAGSDRILDIMVTIRPTGLQGSPGFLQSLGSRAEERAVSPRELGVRTIMTGGEPGGGIPSVRSALESMWGAPVREVMGGSDLVVLMWAECSVQDGMHFMAPDYVVFEIIDPKTDQPVAVEPAVSGELVYTHLQREAAPVVRFKHRDLVTVVGTGLCECGRRTPRIRCSGRSDDMLIIKGINLFPSAIKEVLSREVGPGVVFRIRRRKGDYVLPGPVDLVVASPQLHATASADLESTLHQSLACRFSVTVVEPGSLTVPGATKDVFFEEVE